METGQKLLHPYGTGTRKVAARMENPSKFSWKQKMELLHRLAQPSEVFGEKPHQPTNASPPLSQSASTKGDAMGYHPSSLFSWNHGLTLARCRK